MEELNQTAGIDQCMTTDSFFVNSKEESVASN